MPKMADGYSSKKGKGKKGKMVQPSVAPTWNGYNWVQPTDSPGQSPEERAIQALADLGYTGLSVEDLARLNPPDEYEEALLVMADVRAYFQVAYKVHFTSSRYPSSTLLLIPYLSPFL